MVIEVGHTMMNNNLDIGKIKKTKFNVIRPSKSITYTDL